ncbi:MAG: FMN-binding protein [Spirochaetes bacterium]|nr:FMN-binding protein [Spirochaetota bacterium]
MKKDGIIYTILFSFTATFLVVLILGFAYQSTSKKVSDHAGLINRKVILSAFGYEVTDENRINQDYSSIIKTVEIDGIEIYVTEKDGSLYFGKKFAGNGLWGTITGVIAVNSTADEIYGFKILSHNETPGLGARIEEKWFLDQMKNEAIGPSGISLNRNGSGKGDTDKSNSSIDAITGATQTSVFISRIINNEIKILKKIAGKLK